MIEEARGYLASRNITRREPLYSANKYARLIGDHPVNQINSDKLQRFREAMVKAGLRPRTIESAISDIVTVVRHYTGKQVEVGTRIRSAIPQPIPVERDVIDEIWKHSQPWLRAWMALSYWTGLRLTDGLNVLKDHKEKPLAPVLRWTASKTSKPHVFPIPDWLRKIVSAGPYPLRTTADFARRQVRSGLHAACLAANVAIVIPKQFRQRAVTEWSVASAAAGAILHGSGLRVLSHYVDPLTVLESAAPRVRLPASFGATVDSGEQLLKNYQRLDEQAKTIVSMTAERLAAG